ncbi:peptide-methionine (S)-S-oxide reductase [Pararobbsia silviterrae]|uniref:Peptide methionine sulfoxide reductase MsrA n=2 Tax=Pararobbsia silviterrae TaxID=1792498 RepID=A0A494X6Y1_9BURK|nr:peptide-methionine (S)-S-oxide reductase [Pararobbsia silviterrae]
MFNVASRDAVRDGALSDTARLAQTQRDAAGLVDVAARVRHARGALHVRPPRIWTYGALVLALTFGGLPDAHASQGADASVSAPAPLIDEPANTSHTEVAVLAGGCFWGVQGVLSHVHGVTRVVSGYSGGSRWTAHYERVSDGDTGHAEAVEVTFDPAQISYGRLLQVFFSVVFDPTARNAQGDDEGTQYRSAIFARDDTQRRIASAYLVQLERAHVYRAPIATDIEPYTGFYAAEPYHQDYMARHADSPYIVANDAPKLDALRARFPALYREPTPTTHVAAQ